MSRAQYGSGSVSTDTHRVQVQYLQIDTVGFSMVQVQYLQIDTVGFSMVQVQYLQLDTFRFPLSAW